MNLRLAVVLDRHGNTTNKGANTLYLGDYEVCNAGEQSSRIYVEDSNGDEIEIEDTVADQLELLKNKIVEVRENFITDEYKPKILFMVREGDNGSVNYNKGTIKKLFTKFNEDFNKFIPHHTHVNSLGTEMKLFPFLTENSVYGSIEVGSIHVLTEIMENLTNKMLDDMNNIMTRIYNTLKLYAINISESNLMITESIYKLDNLITRSLSNLIKADEMDKKYTELINSIGHPDKIYTVDNFVNATNGRFSTINLTSKTTSEDDKEPFVDVVIAAMSGSSIVSQCSFRIDKKSRMCSDFYGDSKFFFLNTNDGDCKLPLYVLNRYTYKIATSWNCNVSVSAGSSVAKNNSQHGFRKHLTSVMFDGTHFIASNGKQYKIDMDVDQYNGRIVNTIDISSGSVASSIRSEDTSSSGRTLKIIKGNIVGYFRTSSSKTVSGIQPVIGLPDGSKAYLKHTNPYKTDLVRLKVETPNPRNGSQVFSLKDQKVERRHKGTTTVKIQTTLANLRSHNHGGPGGIGYLDFKVYDMNGTHLLNKRVWYDATGDNHKDAADNFDKGLFFNKYLKDIIPEVSAEIVTLHVDLYMQTGSYTAHRDGGRGVYQRVHAIQVEISG